MKVGVIGASGYTGAEILRLLANHPETDVAYVTANTYRGTRVAMLYPHLAPYGDLQFDEFDGDEALERAEIFFVALPHGKAMDVVPGLHGSGAKVIDLSADYRLDSADEYREWYGVEHTSPELLQTAVYGLPEFFRRELKEATLVAVPGCYPTAVILALAPLLAEEVVSPEGLIADAKSGVSGAGRTLSLGTHFAQCNESVGPYNIGGHRHTPEMRIYLSRLGSSAVSLVFAPHLIPMNRGILATCYGRMRRSVSTAELNELYRDFYRESPFVVVLPEGELAQSKNVQGSNYCHVSPLTDDATGMAIAVSAIDNLVKGASGAAIQCMNIMTGCPEDMGIAGIPVFP